MKKLIGALVTTLAVGGSAAGAVAINNSQEAAQEALNKAGVVAEKAYDVESELDYEKGKPVYEVEFESEGKEYEYELDAETGAVIESKTEKDDDANSKKSATTKESTTKSTTTEKKKETTSSSTSKTTKKTTTTDIGKEKAKSIALKHAGVSASDVTWQEVERDRDDGRLEYKVEFRVGNKEYDYEINGSTGKILESDVDIDDDRYDD